MYILLLWVVLISIHITSWSWSSMFSTFVVLLLISSLVVIATPPPSFPGLCLCVQLAYPWILGGAVFVSFMQIMLHILRPLIVGWHPFLLFHLRLHILFLFHFSYSSFFVCFFLGFSSFRFVCLLLCRRLRSRWFELFSFVSVFCG